MRTKDAGIYAILNTISGRRYVGQSIDVHRRGNKHFSDLLRGAHHCEHLQRAFLKYGKEAFQHVVLEVCNPEKLTEREQYWMDYYKDNGIYNTAPAAGSVLGIVFSDDHKKRIAAALIGVKHSPERTAKMVSSLTGRVLSDDHKAKLSVINKGIKRSAETKMKMSEAAKGRKMSPETRAKLAAAATGRKMSKENRAKLSERAKNGTAGIMSPESKAKSIATRTGRKMSEEQKAKISATLKGRALNPETVAKIAAANTGKKRSPETRERMSAAWYRNHPLPDRGDQCQLAP